MLAGTHMDVSHALPAPQAPNAPAGSSESGCVKQERMEATAMRYACLAQIASPLVDLDIAECPMMMR